MNLRVTCVSLLWVMHNRVSRQCKVENVVFWSLKNQRLFSLKSFQENLSLPWYFCVCRLTIKRMRVSVSVFSVCRPHYHWLVRMLVCVIDIVLSLLLCSSLLLQHFFLFDLHSTTLWQCCSGSCPVRLYGRSGHARHCCFSLFWWTRVPLHDLFVTLKAANVVLHALLARASVCCINGNTEAPYCCVAQFCANWQGRRVGESLTAGVRGQFSV